MLLKNFDKFDNYGNTIETYQHFINTINFRKEFDINYFVGSQPLQILPKDFLSIQKNTIITPKIDGKRYLMILTQNFLGFIDRGNKFYYPKQLKEFNSEFDVDFLFDCEIVENGEQLQIFIFDILFASLEERQLKFKKTYSFYKESFKNRRIHLENHFNLLRRINDMFLNTNVNIKFYLKNFYPFFVFEKLTYKTLINLFNENMELENYEIPEYDGVIFVNINFPYFLSPLPAYGQYKWKPLDKLTIDLTVKKNKTWKVYDKKGNELENIKIDQNEMKESYNEKTLEFLYNKKTKKMYLHKPVIDRSLKGANSFLTIQSTVYASENFFTLEQIHEFYKFLHNNKKNDTLLSWMDEKTAKKIYILCGNDNLNYFNEKNIQTFKENLIKFNDNRYFFKYEVENRELNDKKLICKSLEDIFEDNVVEKYFNEDEKSMTDFLNFLDNNKFNSGEQFILSAEKKFPQLKKEKNDIVKQYDKIVKCENEYSNLLYHTYTKSKITDLYMVLDFNSNNIRNRDTFFNLLYKINSTTHFKMSSNLEKHVDDKIFVYDLHETIFKSYNIKNSYMKTKEKGVSLNYKNNLHFNIDIYFEKKIKIEKENVKVSETVYKFKYMFKLPNFPNFTYLILTETIKVDKTELTEEQIEEKLNKKFQYEQKLFKLKEKLKEEKNKRESEKEIQEITDMIFYTKDVDVKREYEIQIKFVINKNKGLEIKFFNRIIQDINNIITFIFKSINF